MGKKPYSIDESQTHTSGEMKNVDKAETKTSLVKYTAPSTTALGARKRW